MAEGRRNIEATYQTYTFVPYLLTLFLPDLKRLFHLSRETFPGAEFQIGRENLEFTIENSDDLESVRSRLKKPNTELHALYIHIKTPSGERDPNFLLLDVTPTTCTVHISDKNDEKLMALYENIKVTLEKKNIYRFFRNRIVDAVILGLDILLATFLLLFKDSFDRMTGSTLSTPIYLLFGLLLNLVFIAPHGRNKIFLLPEGEINPLQKNRETMIIAGIIMAVGLVFLAILAGQFNSGANYIP